MNVINNTMQLRRAERKQAKLRIGLSGPSGSGKTYSALLIAKGIAGDWSKVCLIDTENGSGDLYSHLGEYQIITLQNPFSPERYIEAIAAAEQAGMQVIVVDSASHEWDGKGGCLEINERIASTKFKGNTWAAWSETTPRHQKFIESLTSSVAHIITCTRSKTDVIQTEDKKIKKVGLKDIQREGFEYELTVSFNIDREGHYAIASKDRTRLFIDRDPFVISEKTGQELQGWNGAAKQDFVDLRRQIFTLTTKLGITTKEREQYAQEVKTLTGLELVESNYVTILDKLTDLALKKVDEEFKKDLHAPQNVEGGAGTAA